MRTAPQGTRTTAMVDLMSQEEQVDKAFTVVRRRARMRRLANLIHGKSARGTLLS
ncbi:MAG TPA: hypothetical protein VF068_12355 [Rubrobacter sp.]